MGSVAASVVSYLACGIVVAILKQCDERPTAFNVIVNCACWPIVVTVDWVCDRLLASRGHWEAVQQEDSDGSRWCVQWSLPAPVTASLHFVAAQYDSGTASAESFAVAHAAKLNQERKRPEDFV